MQGPAAVAGRVRQAQVWTDVSGRVREGYVWGGVSRRVRWGYVWTGGVWTGPVTLQSKIYLPYDPEIFQRKTPHQPRGACTKIRMPPDV